MIFIVEGPDGAGKTTLISNVFPDIEYIHYSHFPTRNDAFTTFERLLESLIENPRNLIIDRFHISERIYGIEYHNEKLSNHRYNYIESLCKLLNIRVICCLPSWLTVQENWSARLDNEMIQDSSHLYKIWHSYSCIKQQTSLPIIMYDYQMPEAEHCLKAQLSLYK
jgi:hypothetical protein